MSFLFLEFSSVSPNVVKIQLITITLLLKAISAYERALYSILAPAREEATVRQIQTFNERRRRDRKTRERTFVMLFESSYKEVHFNELLRAFYFKVFASLQGRRKVITHGF